MAFDATYVMVKELGELSNGRKVEIGHYKENSTGKEYADKIYIRSTYETKKGEIKESINSTQLTLEDFKLLQKIKLSKGE